MHDADEGKSFELTDVPLYVITHGCRGFTKLNISGCSAFGDNLLACIAGFCRRWRFQICVDVLEFLRIVTLGVWQVLYEDLIIYLYPVSSQLIHVEWPRWVNFKTAVAFETEMDT